MRNNLVVIVVGAVIVSCLLISTFAVDRAVGQPKDVPASAAGRYQMGVGQTLWGVKREPMDVTYVLDTQTGQVWRKAWADREWHDWGNPTRKDKKE